jgi:hypothetical protein
MGIQTHEIEGVTVLAAVAFLRQHTVATQVREVDFATQQQDGGKQDQQKLLLRFAKCPILVNRACRISIVLPLWCGLLSICTLKGGVAFCLLALFFSPKTVRTIAVGEQS